MKLDSLALAVLVCSAFLVSCSEDPAKHEDTHEDEHEQVEQVEQVSLTAEAYDAAGIAVAPVTSHALTPTVKVKHRR